MLECPRRADLSKRVEMLSKLEKTETLADKYQNLGRNLIGLVSESEHPYAYSLLLDAHESIEILLSILSNKTNTRSIDEIALIHLNYQMLGAALEKLPRKFTLKFPHLSQAVFANTIDAKGACWIPRVICAHIVSFEELYLNYNNKLEEQFLSEIIIIKDAIQITIEKQLKPLLSVLKQPLKISINPSNEWHYSNPKTTETKIPNTLQYVDNCIGVLSEVERIASCNYSILSKSLARQSLIIQHDNS